MIGDLHQPAKDWLADHLQNFGGQLKDGDDPSCIIEFQGVEIEVRLNKIPGHFERVVSETN